MHRNGCTGRGRSIKPEFPVRHLGQHELYIQPPPGEPFSLICLSNRLRRSEKGPLCLLRVRKDPEGASFQVISHTHLRPPPSFDLLPYSLGRPVRSAAPAPRAAAPYSRTTAADNKLVRRLTYVSGLVNQELLLQTSLIIITSETDKSDLTSSVFKLSALRSVSPAAMSRSRIDCLGRRATEPIVASEKVGHNTRWRFVERHVGFQDARCVASERTP